MEIQMFLPKNNHVTEHSAGSSSEIVCSENGMKYCAKKSNNNHTAYRYKIDGGIITGNDGKRCDYIVENESTKHLYFVELKGSDFPKACSQISATVKRYEQNIGNYQIHARIVLSRSCSHSVNNEKYRDLRKMCPDIISKNVCFEEKI